MEIKRYELHNLTVQYLIDDNKSVTFFIVPKGAKQRLANAWEKGESPWDARARYMNSWKMGSLAYFMTSDLNCLIPGLSMKNENLVRNLKFENQVVEKTGKETKIITFLAHNTGYKIIHTLTHIQGLRGLICETEFVNDSENDTYLTHLSSFTLDNLSPFQNDDGDEAYVFHRYYGGWSMEGKKFSQTIEEMSLEKSWAGFGNTSERFGSMGSYPVDRYFPAAVFEDRKSGISWGAQIAHNATWQMELTRIGDTMSFSGGLGDREFCGWKKQVKKGESFKAPKAYLGVAEGGSEEAMSVVLDMLKPARKSHGEVGLPVAFNEYCTTWGKPTQEKMLSYCKNLKELGVKYAVIDAGWCVKGQEQQGNGEWPVDKTIFPDMLSMNKKIREMGMIPGIWFEFEVTTKGSRMYEKEYDDMHLKRDGRVVNVNDFRSYWDFRRKDVHDYLYEKVIKFLKDNQFGYIKVDYNANIGIDVDGEEQGAENLRQHLEAVRNFFIEMKREIPDLIIENCSSGGHRLEPSMMEASAVSSFSDAHEAVEIPYIAANLHQLMLPSQSLIWAVIHSDESEKRTIYSMASTFLGRICLSGQIDILTDKQVEILKNAIHFYSLLTDVIENGDSSLYGNRSKGNRYPKGTQVVLRSTENEILAVCHGYENTSDTFTIEIPEGFKLKSDFYAKNMKAENGKITVNKMEEFSAEAILLCKE